MKPLWKISHGWDKTHSMVLQGAAEQAAVSKGSKRCKCNGKWNYPACDPASRLRHTDFAAWRALLTGVLVKML